MMSRKTDKQSGDVSHITEKRVFAPFFSDEKEII